MSNRLDRELAERGLARSRSAAAELIRSGRVLVGGTVVQRPAAVVNAGTSIEVEADQYVSRAAYKLLGVLADLRQSGHGFELAGVKALDAGASTGGFTQVLLDAGCVEVIAVDVGHGQLAPQLRVDRRVRVHEHLNVRDLNPAMIGGEPVDLVVADLSFISLTLVLPALVSVVDPDGKLLVLIKPQFEVGRDSLGSGGVLRDPTLHAAAVGALVAKADELGWPAAVVVPSQLPGPAGNQEFFALLTRRPTQAGAESTSGAAGEQPHTISRVNHRDIG